jgi:hypothetical protein
MKLTAEDYRRHYRELSDEELLAIRREDLVEAAQKAYDAEFTKRDLDVREVEASADEEEDVDHLPEALEMPAGEARVQIAVILDSHIARDALKTLQEANIPGMVTDDHGITDRYAAASFGLLVPESCADSARDLLAGHLTWNSQALVRKWLEQDWTPDDLELDDFEVKVDEHFGEEYKVAARITVSGVDPHTHQKVKRSGIAIVHLDDGRIGEHWIRL